LNGTNALHALITFATRNTFATFLVRLVKNIFYFCQSPKHNKDMSEALDPIISDCDQQMRKAISHLEAELTRIRAGKANPQILDGISVEYYGNPTPIGQVANITVTDARTLSVQPWEKNMIAPIEKAIMASNIGLTPQNDGQVIRLYLPPLTEERRKELVKQVNGVGEHSKVAVRSIRRESIEQIKKLQKDGLSEDIAKGGEARIQGLTDKYIAVVDEHCKDKEKEIMTI
jgi:ribosome recycling factor